MAVLVVLKNEKGEAVGNLLAEPKTFRTGSRGYYGTAKVVLDGRRYQAQVQLVEIGSRQAGEAAREP